MSGGDDGNLRNTLYRTATHSSRRSRFMATVRDEAIEQCGIQGGQ